MIRRMVKSAAALIFLVGSSVAFALPRTIYVPGDFGTIQEAIDDCNDGDTVIVAEGTHTGAGNKNLDFLGKAIALVSTHPDDPAVVANTVINCQNSGRAFNFHSGEDANSIVSGFTITGGSTYENGAGIYCTGASPSILNCVITNNYAENCGGGIYCTSNSNPVIINCTISGNTAQGPDGFDFGVPGGPGYGGGIYGSPDSHLTIQDCTITGNTASGGVAFGGIVPPAPADGNAYGGGICGNATIDDCIISDNTAAGGYSEGGTSRAFGGGIYGVVQITKSKITGNTSVAEGDGPSLFPPPAWSVCACGGGVFALSDSSVTNCLIAQNQAYRYPESMGFGDNLGGGLCPDPQSEVDIRNCTIVANTASGGYLEVEGLGGGIYSNSTTTVANSILWANAADSGTQIYGPGPVSYSDVQGGRTGEGNINADPLFADPAGNDYHLEPPSPCINVGDNNAVPPSVVTDLDGNPRIIDGTVDMGAYESPVTTYELTVIVTGGYGVVEPNSGFYPPGTVVTLMATPSEGYRLAQWTGADDDISLCLTNTVTMNGDRFVTVELEESYPRTLYVGSGPEYTTIQDAIDDAREGDIVVIPTGTYPANIRLRGANITLTSTVPDDPMVVAATIIDGMGAGSVVTFTGCEDETCVLDGLTIADGNAIGDGGGISGNGAQATISNCVIRNNRANGCGGGVSDYNGLLRKCTITDNSAQLAGGGLSNCNGQITHCTVSDNIAASGGGLSNYTGQLVNCIITGNAADDGDGGGIFCPPHTDPVIINCTITGNWAWFKGGGIFCGPNSLPTITNCILWENDAEFGRQIYTFGGFPVVTYSDVQGGHAGEGNIDADPQFVDPNSGDYHLGAGSPCIDVGDNNAVPPSAVTDMDGNPRIINGVVDLGPYETIFFYVDGINGNDDNNGRSPETAFATIQKGINSAQDGCVVLVYPAVYLNPDPEVWEEIDFLGKNIKLTSADPADWSTVRNTIIAGSVFFSGTEDPNCTLAGFTIRHLANGAIYGNHTHATISHCILSGNAPCGAIVMEYCDGTISNCLITDNSTIFLCGAYPVVFGCHGLIENCTIANNSTNIGVLNGDTTTIQNCIIYANGDPNDPNTCQVGIADGGTLNISYSNVEGGLTGIYNDGDVNWGPGNIDTDPCFARMGYWDWDAWPLQLYEGDYHLMSEGWRWDADIGRWTYDYVTSRSIDAGNPGSPLGDELMSVPADPSNEWGINLRINMGAYGGTAEASMAPHGWALLADLTNDGIVDWLDVAGQVQDWLSNGKEWPGDLDRNAIVNFVDWGLLAHDWLAKTTWHAPYIVLNIYSDGWGTLLDTIIMNTEGEISISVEEEYPYYDPPLYYIYAFREGYYTELYYCEKGETINVDLDPIVPGLANGVVFMTQQWFADFYLSATDVTVREGDTVIAQFQTDEQGRFAIDLQPGNYYFEFTFDFEEYSEEVEIQGQYQDFFFPAPMVVYKPNIYLYPEETIELDVEILFPHGGQITTAVPDYSDAWHISVEPSGVIDGQYEYLFYESSQPDYGQYDTGWVVAREELGDFFSNNMAQTGFNQEEIDDFVDYWIPILTYYPYYAIYPQYNNELDRIIQLELSTQPQSLIRLIYSVRGLENNNLDIQQPVIPAFTREGFTVTEWGVILK